MKDVTPPAGITHRIENWFLNNLRVAGAAVLLIILAGIGWTAMSYLNEQKEMKAQKELYLAHQSFESITKEAQDKANKESQIVDPKTKKNMAAPPAAINPAEIDYSESLAKLEKLIVEAPKTQASVQAAHKAADLYILKGKFPEAQTVLEKVMATLSKNSILDPISRLKLAGIFEKQKKFNEAISQLDKVVELKSFPYLKSEALLQKAICLEQLGQNDQAKSILQQLTKEFGETAAGKQAAKYYRLLTMKKG